MFNFLLPLICYCLLSILPGFCSFFKSVFICFSDFINMLLFRMWISFTVFICTVLVSACQSSVKTSELHEPVKKDAIQTKCYQRIDTVVYTWIIIHIN